MRNSIPLLLIWMSVARCQDSIGDSCTTNEDLPGVCILYKECKYARDLVNVKRMKPTDCFYMNSLRVVCCPTEEAPTTETRPLIGAETTTKASTEEHEDTDSPVEMDYLLALTEGVMRFNRTVCRNDGNFPITCCHQEYPTYTLDRDRNPPHCPPLPRPEIEREMDFTPHLQVIWEACLNYSMEGSRCIPSQEFPNQYQRDQCLDEQTGTKVADGVPANLKQFPHMVVFGTNDVNMSKRKNKKIIWYGGGSLISEYFVLTAGHVLLNNEHGLVQYALMGARNKTDLRSGVLYHVARAIPHPMYKWGYKPNDIALVELSRRVSFTEFIRPLCFKVPGLQITSERAVAGWGRTGHGKDTSEILLTALIYEMPGSNCKRALRSKYFNWDDETMICSGAHQLYSHGLPDTCQGDSGGPLMARIKELPCSSVVVGVVSWGARCGVGEPASYTNATYIGYLEWIAGVVWPDRLKQKLDMQITLY